MVEHDTYPGADPLQMMDNPHAAKFSLKSWDEGQHSVPQHNIVTGVEVRLVKRMVTEWSVVDIEAEIEEYDGPV
jgi:hypothetical protein